MNLNFLLSATTLIGLNFANPALDLSKETTKPINAKFSKIQSNKTILLSQQQPNIVSKRGFDFEFTGCEPLSTDELICSFIVVNNKQPRSLSLFPNKSRIVDEKGNVILGAVAQLGTRAPLGGTAVESEELPLKIPISGKVLFRNIPGGATIKIRYIEFHFTTFKIPFSIKN